MLLFEDFRRTDLVIYIWGPEENSKGVNFSVSPGDPMGSLGESQLHYLCPCILAL